MPVAEPRSGCCPSGTALTRGVVCLSPRRPLFRRPAPGTTCGRSVELRQRGEGHEQLDRPRNAWSPSDESALLKLDNHPMDGGRSDPKEPLHVGLRGRASVELQIGVDEREVLPLLARK